MEEIKQLLKITKTLKNKYGKAFTLDGKLVGDIGEVLAAEKYGLDLLEENTPIHDATEKTTGRMIQIKSTFKGFCYFPHGVNRIPDFFLSIQIDEEGNISELFNGPGKYIYENYILKNNLKPYRNSYFSLSKGELVKLNRQVSSNDKIKTVK